MKKTFLLFILSCSIFSREVSANKTHVADIDSLLLKSEKLLPLNADSALICSYKAAELSMARGLPAHLARSYYLLGKAYNRLDDVHSEISYFQKAKAASENTTDEKLKAQIALELAKALSNKGNYDESLVAFRQAKAIAEKISDKNILYGVFSLQGNIFLSEDNWDSAGYYFNKTLAGAIERKDTLEIANSNRHLSFVHFKKKKWDEGMKFINTAIQLYEKIDNDEGIAKTYKDLGDAYWEMKNNKKAIEYYSKAYEIQKARKNISRMSVGACDLAYMYALDNRKDLMDQYAEEAYSLAQKTRSWSIIKYSSLWLSEAYEIIGNDKRALFYHKALVSINDSITNRARIQKNSREELEDVFEEKVRSIKQEEQKRQAIAEEKAHNQKVVRNILTAGFVVALILLFIAYRSYVAKKKANVIISKQKEEVELQKQKIEEINKEITDSINYAKIIQRSILPEGKEIMKIFPESFGLYKPKSVVSGDFYWFHKKNNTAMIAAVDCTGHGVPGALMSMIGVEKLNEAVAAGLTLPSDILMDLNRGVKTTLRQKDLASVSKDGMDIALCSFDLQKNTLRFSGAQRPLWIIRNKELTEYKSTKVSIGGTTPDGQEFISHELQLQKGDAIYIFSDGFADQFGGGKGKKIMTKNFKEVLLSIQNIPFLEQENVLDKKLTEWQGDYEQVDDILVIGIRVPHP